MMYSYAFTLCRRAVVATLDLSAQNIHLLSTDHWLSDPRNVIVLNLSEPAWEGADASAIPSPLPMAAWCVSEVARWLEGSDMSGPASILRSQGVNGEDLVSFETAVQFSHDVGLSMFAARKILRLRDQHLAMP